MNQQLRDEILELKQQQHAIILAHNYVEAEIQNIADFCGDSLELSQMAAKNQAETIVFCGVKFMGETAKLLSPGARVLMPTESAGCPMADMCQPGDLKVWREAHPEHTIVAYVNTTAHTKALVDICVTSGNAERILTKLDTSKPIMFLPDQNLGSNLNKKLHLNMDLWNGCCRTHNRISVQDIQNAREAHPGCPVMVHLECRPEVVDISDAALSTAGMLKFVQSNPAKAFIVGTEYGMIHRLKTVFPDREFYGLVPSVVCPNMKRNTLELVRDCLLGKGYEVTLPPDLMESAVRPIRKMLELS